MDARKGAPSAPRSRPRQSGFDRPHCGNFSYKGLETGYVHNVIDHLVSYVDENIHTNGCENFGALLKRALKGTYASVEPFHPFRYLDDQSFRFNETRRD
jgi:hypothetical protein